MDEVVRRRFEAKVDRSGDHHLWQGASKPDGTGIVKVDGRLQLARRVAWELANGTVPDGARVERCPDDAACVRVDHLLLAGVSKPAPPTKTRRGAGSMRETAPGRWELSVTAGRYDDGKVRRLFRTVEASSDRMASKALATFVAEVEATPLPNSRQERSMTMDEAVEQFLNEHLTGEKGREPKTVYDYRALHAKWFAPEIGSKLVRAIDEAMIDALFGRMARAGLSRSRMNQAKALYRPFFRWAKSRRLVDRNPMADFQLPTAKKPAKSRTPPEVEELVLLLQTAAEVIPDVAPILALGAVTGMRRGELLGLRRSRLHVEACRLTIDSAIDEGSRVKTTKTRIERTAHVDAETMAMLVGHCREMDERAASMRAMIADDPFVFSNTIDCSEPIPPDYLTRRVGELKGHLGIEDKLPETIELEDEALRLYRQERPARAGRSGPAPKGGQSFAEIGKQIGRSDRWVAGAIAAAERREKARAEGRTHTFDGSILALRKFTSTELLVQRFFVSTRVWVRPLGVVGRRRSRRRVGRFGRSRR